MDYVNFIRKGTPVVVRSYVSGVFAGRLIGGEKGVVAIVDWAWIRSWRGVGGAGSVYDLIASAVTPDHGPRFETPQVIQQADVVEITEDQLKRLSGA